jgi:hypothetical protein
LNEHLQRVREPAGTRVRRASHLKIEGKSLVHSSATAG